MTATQTGNRRAAADRDLDRIALPQRLVLLLLLIAFGIYCLLPAWWLIVASTKSTGDLFSTAGLWFSGHLDLMANLRHLFSYQDGIFVRWMLNTLAYAGVGAGFSALFAAAGGYVFAKFRFRGRTAFFACVIGGVMVPANILAVPLYLLFSQIHATNTFWSVFLPGLVSPFGLYLCRIFADAGVPDEILEAARMDGAGELRIFFSIALRLMTPALLTIFLFQLVGIWNNVLLPLIMLNDPTYFPVTLGLYGMYASSSTIGASPEITATVIMGVFVSVVPLVVVFLALQKYWRGGVAIGAVRG